MRGTFRYLGLGLFTLLLWGGCGDSSIAASDYDRSCTQASDCTVILVGEICDCSCTYGAINKQDLALYEADRQAISCDKDCGPCQGAAGVQCVDDTCRVQP